MEQHWDGESAGEGSHTNLEQPWPCVEILKTLAELNEQGLELLVEQAKQSATQGPPIFQELQHLWRNLSGESRRRAARCPYLLVDAGFTDPFRWRWVSEVRVEDREPEGFSIFLTVPGAGRLTQQIFTNAWHIARTQSTGVPLFLGMPVRCVSLLKACTLRQVVELAERQARWLRPRWAGRVPMWKQLLVGAISGDEEMLEKVRLHGVQMLATELRLLESVSLQAREQSSES